MVLVLIMVVMASVGWLVLRTQDQPRFEVRLASNGHGRLEALKWLAALPLVPAAPLLFFGLSWFAPGLIAGGLAFVATALCVWRLFAREWPVARLP